MISKWDGSGSSKTRELWSPHTVVFGSAFLTLPKRNTEDFFEALFNRQMYTIMAEETNKYANCKIERGKLCTRCIYFMVQEALHYTHIIWHATVQNQLQLHQPEHVSDPLSLYSTYTCPAGECHVSLSNLLLLLLSN